MRVQSLDAQPPGTIPNPTGLQFVTALVCQDRLRSFIELLDPWTRKAFYAIHIDDDDVPHAAVARRFGMKENSFNKRLSRGMEKAKEKYLALYGAP
jgi:DNA-directed RNA polymerase specialized sigma24 family protein